MNTQLFGQPPCCFKVFHMLRGSSCNTSSLSAWSKASLHHFCHRPILRLLSIATKATGIYPRSHCRYFSDASWPPSHHYCHNILVWKLQIGSDVEKRHRLASTRCCSTEVDLACIGQPVCAAAHLPTGNNDLNSRRNRPTKLETRSEPPRNCYIAITTIVCLEDSDPVISNIVHAA